MIKGRNAQQWASAVYYSTDESNDKEFDMHFNDFVKVIISELKTMTGGNKEAFFTFYDIESGKLVSCTKQAAMTASGEECCIFFINNFDDDHFEVVMNEGCGELLLEDFESQPCSEGAACAVALKIYETLSEM